MSRILRRFSPALFGMVILVAACGGKDGGQPSTPTAPTPAPATPAPAPPTTPPANPPQPTACSYAVAAEPDDYGRDGGNGMLKINTAAGCRWSVGTDATWASIEGSAAGEGPATLKVLVRANEDAQARRMTFTVEGQQASVSQPGQGDCSYEVKPVAATIPSDRWSDVITIATDPGCQWTAASTNSWFHLRSSGGNGSGTLTYEADANPNSGYATPRMARVELRWLAPTAGQNVMVEQFGTCNINAAPNVLPSGATLSASPGGGTVTVGADGGIVRLFILAEPWMTCPWVMESSDTWIEWNWPQMRTIQRGDGDTRFTVPPNPSSNGRTAIARFGGWPLTVIQRGR